MKRVKYDTRLDPETMDNLKKQAKAEKSNPCAIGRKIIEEYYEGKDESDNVVFKINTDNLLGILKGKK